MGQVWKVLRWVFGIGLLVLLVCGGGAVFLGPKIMKIIEDQRIKGQGTPVVVEKSNRTELVRTISAPGTVTPTQEVNISARVSAKIARLPFQEGAVVKEGDVVVELDSKDLAAQVAAAEARLLADRAGLKGFEAALMSDEAGIAGLKATYDKATADWERQEELFKSGDISKADLDVFKANLEQSRAALAAREASLNTSRANVEAAKARVLMSEADLTQSKENLGYATIRSPLNGNITQLNAKVGEVVVVGTMNNAGTVIMKIADLSEMLVKARLAEIDVPNVKEGQRVQVLINGYGDKKFEGTLRRVGLQSKVNLQDATAYFEGEILLHLNNQTVFAGLTATVDIEIESLPNVVTVPSQAVIDKRVEELPLSVRDNALVDKDKTFAQVVFVKEGGKAKLRPVKTSARNVTRTAITAGLEPDVEVIVGPFKALSELTDDASVRLMGDEKKDATGGQTKSGGTTVTVSN